MSDDDAARLRLLASIAGQVEEMIEEWDELVEAGMGLWDEDQVEKMFDQLRLKLNRLRALDQPKKPRCAKCGKYPGERDDLAVNGVCEACGTTPNRRKFRDRRKA